MTPQRRWYLANKDKARASVKRFQAGELQVLCANCNWIKRAENKEVKGVRKAS